MLRESGRCFVTVYLSCTLRNEHRWWWSSFFVCGEFGVANAFVTRDGVMPGALGYFYNASV